MSGTSLHSALGPRREPLLTSRQAAEFLNYHVKTLPRLISRDGLPCLWIGRRRRFALPDIQRWLSARERRG